MTRTEVEINTHYDDALGKVILWAGLKFNIPNSALDFTWTLISIYFRFGDRTFSLMHVRPSTGLYLLVKTKIDPCRESKSDISDSLCSDETIIKRFSDFRSSVADAPVPLGYSATSIGNGCRRCEGTWCRQLEGSLGPRRRIDPWRWGANSFETLESDYPQTQRHIPEGQNCHL